MLVEVLRRRSSNPNAKGQLGGGPPDFDREPYKQRNTVAHWINRLSSGGLGARYEKTATIYQAALHIAGNLIWAAR